MLCLTACSGSDDSDTPEGVLRITVNANTLQANGTESVTFKVMYGSVDVSRSADMNLISGINSQQTPLDNGINTFSTSTPGVYTFTARYKDGAQTLDSDNTITITATAIAGSEKDYFCKMMAMQFTSVGCVNCPFMSTTLKMIQEEQPERLAIAALHLPYGGYTDPMFIQMASIYGQKLNVTALPTCFLNLRTSPLTSEKSSITTAMQAELDKKAVTCGVAIESTYNATSREVAIVAKITSNTSTIYRYLIMLTEDNLEAQQLGATDADYRHNHVVRAVLSSNVYGERLNLGVALQPGVEITTSRTTVLPATWKTENMHIIVAALTTQDSGVTYTCNNSNECKLGENADYLINK